MTGSGIGISPAYSNHDFQKSFHTIHEKWCRKFTNVILRQENKRTFDNYSCPEQKLIHQLHKRLRKFIALPQHVI